MGANGAEDGCGSCAVKCFGSPPKRRTGGHNVVDQQYGSTRGARACRKTPLRQLEAAVAGVSGLTTETVSSEEEYRGLLEPPGDPPSQQLGSCPRFPQPSPRVRGNRNNDVDLRRPQLGCNHRCEAITERCCEIIASAVFEGENCRAEHPVVLAPRDRRALRRGGVDAGDAVLAVALCRNATAGAAVAGSRYGERPARAAQTAISSFERMIAVWTHAGKQGLNCRGQRAPRLHGAHPTRFRPGLRGGCKGFADVTQRPCRL
jgi:hypothetical protein